MKYHSIDGKCCLSKIKSQTGHMASCEVVTDCHLVYMWSSRVSSKTVHVGVLMREPLVAGDHEKVLHSISKTVYVGVLVRGMRATQTIAAKDQVSRTPPEALISKFTIRQSPIGHIFAGSAAQPCGSSCSPTDWPNRPETAPKPLHQNAVQMSQRESAAVFLLWQVCLIRKAMAAKESDAWNHPTKWSGFVRDMMVTPQTNPQLQPAAVIAQMPRILRTKS